jgi:hypothetical protein
MAISARLTLLLVAAGFSSTILLAQKPDSSDECARTFGMKVYSNVFIHEETGDLLGYDLAIKRNADSSVDALLYVYEGGASDDGIPLSGQLINKRLAVQGTWVEHLTEYPSKRTTVEKRFVKIVADLGPATLSGKLTIQGMNEREAVRLKGEEIPRLCRGGSSSLTFTGVHPRNSKREPTKAHVKEKLDGPIGESKPHGMTLPPQNVSLSQLL